MLNRVVVTIDGFDYTVVSEDPEEHIRKSAALVDKSIQEVKASTTLSTVTAVVLAGMNIADKYYKAQAGTDGLRLQIKDYAEECARLKKEVKEAKEAKKAQ